MTTTYKTSFEAGPSTQKSQGLDDASSLVIPHENLEDKIYARLKTLIREQRVAIGVRIQPDHLAREMGVSRTPVLNALKRLAGEQIVEWVPRRGIYLKTLTKRELARVFEVREALECLAVRLAAVRITQEQVEHLAGLFRDIEINSTSEAHALYLERDRELHWHLLMISGNRYLMHAMEAVNVMIFTYQYGLNRPMAETMQEHTAILEALRKRDPDACEAAMRLHVGRTRERIDQLADEEEGINSGRANDRITVGSHAPAG
jgi:DNA-binding GntR family transcriptional regulator